MSGKNFKKDLQIFIHKIAAKENFAFVRFSDGEADILNNIQLTISDDYVIEGNFKHNFGYSKEDHKHFDPQKHGFVRKKLIDSFLFSKKNYYTGIACPCCIGGIETHRAMKKATKRTNKFLTWANLFVNGNYTSFIEDVVPALSNRKIVMVCSKNANLERLKKEINFNIVKDFRVGENCIVNDHHLIDDIKKWIENNNIKDHVFLFSASSLSEILIHELFKDYDKNTYLDIGTTLHPYFNLGYERDYLKGYWLKQNLPDIKKNCQWAYDVKFIKNEERFWDNIRDLRNNPDVKTGFTEQKHITLEEHQNFMSKYASNFYVSLVDNQFVGYAGVIDKDIRIAIHPDFQGLGIGKIMINNLMNIYPDAFAKVKINNEASLALFEKCGFSKKYYILEKDNE